MFRKVLILVSVSGMGACSSAALASDEKPPDVAEWRANLDEIVREIRLGLVQRRMGNNQEAFASHQCVNKVDPTNHNAAAIRQRLAELGGDKVPEPPDCPVH